jgi:hypothetical protein
MNVILKSKITINLQNFIKNKFVPNGYAENNYIKKKLSDFYLSKILPDFYYESKYTWKYSPYVITSRYIYTSIGFFVLYKVYKNHFKKEIKKEKTFNFGIYTKDYLNYEKSEIIKEKEENKKLII